MKNAYAAIFLALFACSNVERTLYKARGFSDAQLAMVRDAADEWCTMSEGKHCVTIVKAPGEMNLKTTLFNNASTSTIALVPFDDAFDDFVERETGERYAAKPAGLTLIHPDNTVNKPCMVFINSQRKATNDSRTDEIRIVALHELGHCFAKQHDHVPGRIMSVAVPLMPDHLTQWDVAGD